MAAEQPAELPAGIDIERVEPIASDRGLQPDALVQLLAEFQAHWESTDFLEVTGTPRGGSPRRWYLTVPTEEWEEHVRGLQIESHEWLAVRDVYDRLYREWGDGHERAHVPREFETPVILAREGALPDPVEGAEVGSDSSADGGEETADGAEGEAAVMAEWEVLFGLQAMDYGTRARGTATIEGPSGTVTVEREFYAHPRTEASEAETPRGMVRVETSRRHTEFDEELPAETVTVELGEAVSQESMPLAERVVETHVQMFGSDYGELAEVVDVCEECGAIPDPDHGVYVEEIPALEGTLCWECFGVRVGSDDDIKLTQRQAETTFLLRTTDLSYGEVGDLLNVRTSSVETHAERARRWFDRAEKTLSVRDSLEAARSR